MLEALRSYRPDPSAAAIETTYVRHLVRAAPSMLSIFAEPVGMILIVIGAALVFARANRKSLN
jgi:hypothetical protein